MNFSSSILADSDVDLPKIIFGVIFFLIWVLSAVVSWVNKKQQEAKRQRAREEMERSIRYGQQQQPSPQRQRVNRPGDRPAQRRIAEGIAQRFPDVLLPPSPPRVPPLPPPLPQQQRRPVPPPPPKPVRRTP
ncbi:MAG: hypothetical protein WBD40_11960, partial [Tepidisphaeraceae bacterium]